MLVVRVQRGRAGATGRGKGGQQEGPLRRALTRLQGRGGADRSKVFRADFDSSAIIDAAVQRRDVAQFGSAPALGAGCRRFESCHPDHSIARHVRPWLNG